MGAYLSEPVTDKCSTEEDLDFLSYGASAMQGWRTTQEDSHNCIPNFDKSTSFFSVYDGHGGAEVAQYCSLHLPDYFKSLDSYKQNNLAQALEDSFLGFDESLTRKEVIAELRQLAGTSERHEEEEDTNEVDHLCNEAQMPLEEVLAKYATVNNQIARIKEAKKTQSPFLRAKDRRELKTQTDENQKIIITEVDDDEDKKVPQPDMSNGDLEIEEIVEKGDGDSTTESKLPTANKSDAVENEMDETESAKPSSSSGSTSSSSNDDSLPGCSTDEPGSSSVRSTRFKAVTCAVDDETSSSEDETYQEIPYADSDSDDEDNSGEENVDDEKEEDDEDEEETEEDEMDEENDDEEEEIDLEMENEPGFESGCTAVVALIRGTELYVANAGDSRCVVCRNGKAIDMSVDHKPEEEVEMRRINNAGGKVTSDGRVNGGLNLSRAIGDHTYKQNKKLSLREQMITSLPDIQTITLNPEEDKFMILACDGIWNYMKSQEVVDFIKDRLEEKRLSAICEELFDVCLAPNTQGDGTGCDNMTAIIVRFHPSLRQMEIGSATKKRRFENGDVPLESSDSKRIRDSGDSKVE
ncbi:hypothetical protein CHUAL_013052 [Chamberlinius hualienensis]